MNLAKEARKLQTLTVTMEDAEIYDEKFIRVKDAIVLAKQYGKYQSKQARAIMRDGLIASDIIKESEK